MVELVQATWDGHFKHGLYGIGGVWRLLRGEPSSKALSGGGGEASLRDIETLAPEMYPGGASVDVVYLRS